jgi:hypothetical protein
MLIVIVTAWILFVVFAIAMLRLAALSDARDDAGLAVSLARSSRNPRRTMGADGSSAVERSDRTNDVRRAAG